MPGLARTTNMTTNAEEIARLALEEHGIRGSVTDTVTLDQALSAATTAAEVAADEVQSERSDKLARETRSEALKRGVEATRLDSGYPSADQVLAFARRFETYLNGEASK